MFLSSLIVEQLDIDGYLRTFRMQPDREKKLTVAFAGEYNETITGPFHFLEDRHRLEFEAGFAECSARKLTSYRFEKIGDGYRFKTSWRGIPSLRGETSYYALSLPENTIPELVRFCDPRSKRDFNKSVERDSRRNCFVLYLECRSSSGSFDFDLYARFSAPTETFSLAEYSDEWTVEHYARVDTYEYDLQGDDVGRVRNFFAGDVYNITGQAAAVGPDAKAEGNSLTQINLGLLGQELEKLHLFAKNQVDSKDHEEELAALGNAVKAANAGDKGGVVKHLKKAGRWALRFADAAGVSIAASIIAEVLAR